MKNRVITLLQELIKNRCINDGTVESGFETRSAESIRKLFTSYNIQSEILEAKPGRGSILSRIKGTDPSAPSLMFMGHLDVVPANEALWSHKPFEGEIAEAHIWGRGAIDMLNLTAAAAVGFAEAVSKHGPYPGDLIYLGEADEEANGRLGARWLAENHWDKVAADYVITEGGGFFIGDQSHIAMAAGEKGMASVKLETRGKAGHGSLPYKADHAGVKMARAVDRLASGSREPLFTGEYKQMVTALPLNKELKEALLTAEGLEGALEKVYDLYPGLAKQLHAGAFLTMNPNVLKAGRKVNIIPDTGTIELDVRVLPGQTLEDVYEKINAALGSLKEEFTIEIVDFFPSNTSLLKTPLLEATTELMEEYFPGAKLVPMLYNGVTDARFWRARGATVYGFVPFDKETTLSDYCRMLHGADEKVSVKSMELAVDYFYKLPARFFKRIEGQKRREKGK